MNTYTYKFTVKCPNDDSSVDYSLIIESDKIIMVEDIIKACEISQAYQEEIADILKEELPGRQTITAIHSSVEIETVRDKKKEENWRALSRLVNIPYN